MERGGGQGTESLGWPDGAGGGGLGAARPPLPDRARPSVTSPPARVRVCRSETRRSGFPHHRQLAPLGVIRHVQAGGTHAIVPCAISASEDGRMSDCEPSTKRFRADQLDGPWPRQGRWSRPGVLIRCTSIRTSGGRWLKQLISHRALLALAITKRRGLFSE